MPRLSATYLSRYSGPRFSAANNSSTINGKLKPFDDIPGPRGLPVIGNIWRYFPLIGDYKVDTLFENAQFNRERYGSLVRERITNEHTVLHLFDPNDIEEYIRQDGKCPYRRSHRALLKYRTQLPELYRDGGLFPENGPNWYRQRAQFQKDLMSIDRVNKCATKIDRVAVEVVDDLMKHLKSRKALEIKDFQNVIYRWALGTSLATFLDLEINSLDEEYVDHIIRQLEISLEATDGTDIRSQKWMKDPDGCKYFRMLSESQSFLHSFVTRNLDNRPRDPGSTTPSFLNDWLDRADLDRKDVVSFIIDLLMAGLHTTSYMTAFLLYNLANHPVILSRVRHEFAANHDGGHLNSETIDKLTTLRDCLKETLRLNPVSIGTGRLTSHEISIRGYRVPVNIMIIAQNQSVGRDKTIFKDASRFNPDRWAIYRTCPRDKRPSPFAFLPFGFGPRACIGQRVAELQIKIFTARLIQNLDFKFKKEIDTKTKLIHTISNDIHIEFTNKRCQES